MEEAYHISFLEFVMGYEEHHKWLLEVEEINKAHQHQEISKIQSSK